MVPYQRCDSSLKIDVTLQDNRLRRKAESLHQSLQGLPGGKNVDKEHQIQSWNHRRKRQKIKFWKIGSNIRGDWIKEAKGGRLRG
jgi:hypothetical protein